MSSAAARARSPPPPSRHAARCRSISRWIENPQRRRLLLVFSFFFDAAYLEDDDEDVSLNVDDLAALTDDELADLLAGRNPSGYSEEELLRKVS